jgi:hypothetical protein
MPKKYDITFIGHMCYDEIIPFGGKPRVAPGSAVLCGAMVAPRIGKKVAAVVKMAEKDEHILQPLKDAGVDTYLIPAEETCSRDCTGPRASMNADHGVKSARLISIRGVPVELDVRPSRRDSDTEFDMALMRIEIKDTACRSTSDFVRHITLTMKYSSARRGKRT